MMSESYYIGAYWGPRQESETECAEKALQLCRELEKISKIWAQWYEQADSKQAALSSPILPNLERFERLLIEGRHFTDEPRVAVPDLGLHIGIWNGRDGHAASTLSMSCGCWSVWVKNAVVLGVPDVALVGSSEETTVVLGQVMGAFISIFDPDWLRFSSNELAEQLGMHDIDPPLLYDPGWITYTAPRLNIELPGTSFTALAPPLTNPANCVTAGIPPFSVDNASQVEAVNRILEILLQEQAK